MTTSSNASPDDIELYSEGSCHVFAVALHRNLGWSMEVVRDENETWWQDEADPDNYISSVVHVYALDNNGNAWDIHGVRPEGFIPEDVKQRYGVGEISGDECRSEGELATYVGMMEEEDIELPLHSYEDRLVQEAWEVACKCLAGLPGFPEEASPLSMPRRTARLR